MNKRGKSSFADICGCQAFASYPPVKDLARKPAQGQDFWLTLSRRSARSRRSSKSESTDSTAVEGILPFKQ
jgi:hypothetical protein